MLCNSDAGMDRHRYFILNRNERMGKLKNIRFVAMLAAFVMIFTSCSSSSGTERTMESNQSSGVQGEEQEVIEPNPLAELLEKGDGGIDTATFAAGCFWCIEAQFLELAGVNEVNPGYTGGRTKNPTYKEVVTGKTGHAEAINVIYDSDKISFDELLEAFFVAHDPTQLNRQGNDVGTQYRSAIFYHNLEQKKLSEYYIAELTEEEVYAKPIVTEVSPLNVFYEAEDYHKNYYALNPSNPYCQRVIQPKLEKFKEVFSHKLKTKTK